MDKNEEAAGKAKPSVPRKSIMYGRRGSQPQPRKSSDSGPGTSAANKSPRKSVNFGPGTSGYSDESEPRKSIDTGAGTSGYSRPRKLTDAGGTRKSIVSGSGPGSSEPRKSMASGSSEPRKSMASGSSEPRKFMTSGSSGPRKSMASGSSEPRNSIDSGSSEPRKSIDDGSSEPQKSIDSGSAEPRQSIDSGSAEPRQSIDSVSSEPRRPSYLDDEALDRDPLVPLEESFTPLKAEMTAEDFELPMTLSALSMQFFGFPTYDRHFNYEPCQVDAHKEHDDYIEAEKKDLETVTCPCCGKSVQCTVTVDLNLNLKDLYEAEGHGFCCSCLHFGKLPEPDPLEYLEEAFEIPVFQREYLQTCPSCGMLIGFSG